MTTLLEVKGNRLASLGSSLNSLYFVIIFSIYPRKGFVGILRTGDFFHINVVRGGGLWYQVLS